MKSKALINFLVIFASQQIYFLENHPTPHSSQVDRLEVRAQQFKLNPSRGSLNYTQLFLEDMKEKSFRNDAKTKNKVMIDFTTKILQASGKKMGTETTDCEDLLNKFLATNSSGRAGDIREEIEQYKEAVFLVLTSKEESQDMLELCLKHWFELSKSVGDKSLDKLLEERKEIRSKYPPISPEISIVVIETPAGLV